ncbi:IclR family transcriptional regulator [Segeticoccus rhizosphaerae]|uniref:IclR family transcriptional regulator n=1 Tax=Segeticoccus rhizosphaerae TaxID=1104777 RepID=UPI0010C04B36|nr:MULTISPECIES: IclR family transcriptional regulator [Intrasporangiaceae]
MRNKPQYAVASVDHALRLAVLLQQEGPLGVSEVAARLGIARSTAHRLLAMLVYRSFAVQLPDKRYAVGPVMGDAPSASVDVGRLRNVALPHLRELVEQARETANLIVLAGVQARFAATVECSQILRVGDREGRSLPAHLVSGGKVLLATLGDDEVRSRLGEASGDHTQAPLRPGEVEALLTELAHIRRQSFAINDQQTEQGVTAVSRLVRGPEGEALASVGLAVPTARFGPEQLPRWVGALTVAAGRIERDLAAD